MLHQKKLEIKMFLKDEEKRNSRGKKQRKEGSRSFDIGREIHFRQENTSDKRNRGLMNIHG